MNGLNKFTKEVANEIRKELSDLRESNRGDQKKIRNVLRKKYCFYISDFTTSNKGFTTADFEDLIKKGEITII